MNARLTLAALVAAAPLFFVTTSARADAASAPEWTGCRVDLGPTNTDGVALPANAPALLLVDGSTRGYVPTVKATLVSGDTRTPLGDPVKDAHGLLTLPLPSLASGEHVVELATTCSNQPEREEKREFRVTLGEEVAPPTSLGTLRRAPQSRPTATETILLDLSEPMRAFQPAARLELTVDGIKVSAEDGFAPAGPREFYVNSGAVCVEDGALHREKRTVAVSVSAAIAGVAQSPEPATFALEVDCGAIQWTDGLTGGGEPPSTTPPSSGEGSSASGGCSSAPSPAGAPSAPVVLALAGLAAMRRRRRA